MCQFVTERFLSSWIIMYPYNLKTFHLVNEGLSLLTHEYSVFFVMKQESKH